MVVTGIESDGPMSVGSYVQTRGSIPMFWKQTINASWAPKPEITQH